MAARIGAGWISYGCPRPWAARAAPWRQTLLERRDILDQEPRFREEGLSALATAVYHLTNGHL